MGLEVACDKTVQGSSRTTLDVVRLARPDQRARSPNASFKCSAESQTKCSKRKMELPLPEVQPAKRQHKYMLGSMQEDLLARVIRSIDHIVTIENIIFVQKRLILLRNWSSAQGKTQQQDMCPLQDLERSWSFIGCSGTDERWAKSLRRVHSGRFYGRYIDERNAYNSRTQKENLRHPIETYIDVCWPETITQPSGTASQITITARTRAKRRFQNELQKAKLWVLMYKRYSVAMFFLLPATLQEDHVRLLRAENLELFLDRIGTQLPNFEDDFQGLSDQLSFFIEHGTLPSQTLRFERLSRSELESKFHEELSLKDLFRPYESNAISRKARAVECAVLSTIDRESRKSHIRTIDENCP